jgi:hypothetical protein
VTLTATGGTKPYTWSLVTGSLPPGLSLGASSGTINGTPTAGGTFHFTVRVASAGSSESSDAAFTLTINAGLTITTVSLPAGTVSSVYSANLNATGGTTPYTWSLASGTLPAGLSLFGTAISGVPLTPGTSSFTVRVTDSSQPAQSAQASLSILINPGPVSITTTSLPSATVGTAYSEDLTAVGGTTPYNWSILAGSLPAGLKLTGATIGGVPTTAGMSAFTVKLVDSSTPPRTVQADLTLSVVAPLVITTASPLPNGTPGVAYSQTLTATGGTPTYRWSIDSGALPQGLTLSTSGTIAGTPSQSGAFNFGVRVTDSSNPPRSVVKSFSLTVGPPLSIVTQSPLPTGFVNRVYSQTLTASGGTPPYSWSVTGGQLPPGLALSTAGVISGTPTTTGSFNATIRVTDSSTTAATRSFALQIDNALAITTTSVPPGSVGAVYSKQLEASVPSGLSWSISSGSLPPGLTLTAAGLISGTPTAGGSFPFTVRVSTGGTAPQTATASFQIDVSPALAITTSATLPRGSAFTPYSVVLAAAGGIPPYAWQVNSGALPAGLVLTTSGTISGQPSQSGNFTFGVQLNDSGTGVTSRVFSLSIDPSTLRITTLQTLPSGIQGYAYSQKFDAAGGPLPYAWTPVSPTLPPGLVLTSDGILQGTPSAPVSATIRIRVTDASGANVTNDFTLAVGPPLSALTLSGLSATVNPASQLPIALSLSAAYPYPVSGTLNMAFSSTAVVPAEDPMTQFSTGGRSVTFTIPANSATAVFPSPLMLLSGTVAGTIIMGASIQNGPSSISFASVSLPAAAPRITSVEASRLNGDLKVIVAGYSTERRMTEIDFAFDVQTTSGIQQVSLSKAVDADFSAWYQSPTSVPFGSTFVLQQLFGVSGDATAITAVTITLKNGQGSAVSSRVTITN